MINPHRLVEIKLRPYEWEVIIAFVLYGIKKVGEDSDMQPFRFGTPRTLVLIRSMEHQIACDTEECEEQNGSK